VEGSGSSPATFAKWRKETGVVQDAAAFRTGLVKTHGRDAPEQLRSRQVTADCLKLLGAPIIPWRPFSAEEDDDLCSVGCSPCRNGICGLMAHWVEQRTLEIGFGWRSVPSLTICGG
jgi:hypothetical protein